MARKAQGKAEGPAVPPPEGAGRLKITLPIRSTDAWKEWLDELTAHLEERDRSNVVEDALKDLAAKHKFRKPPSRLGPKTPRVPG